VLERTFTEASQPTGLNKRNLKKKGGPPPQNKREDASDAQNTQRVSRKGKQERKLERTQPASLAEDRGETEAAVNKKENKVMLKRMGGKGS